MLGIARDFERLLEAARADEELLGFARAARSAVRSHRGIESPRELLRATRSY